MNNRIWIAILLAAILAIGGCATTVRTYSGEQLPPEKEALLKSASNYYIFSIVAGNIQKVDEKDVHGIQFAMLPGKHEIVVYLTFFNSFIGTTTNGVPQTLTIIAEAGHTYIVDGEWHMGDNQIWIIDKQTGEIVADTKHKNSGQQIKTNDTPLNLIPMYGYPEIEKSEELKKADEEFIRTVVANSGSRENASKEFAAEGWRYRRKGDNENAMRRFNQSWLLDPDYYQPYWGFGALLLSQLKAAEAATHFEKALSLIDEDGEKTRLLTDLARAYTIQGGDITTPTDKIRSEQFFGKANSLYNEALILDPQYANAYNAWALSLYKEGNYKKAWEMVRKSREFGRDFDPGFIDALSKEMPEPK